MEILQLGNAYSRIFPILVFYSSYLLLHMSSLPNKMKMIWHLILPQAFPIALLHLPNIRWHYHNPPELIALLLPSRDHQSTGEQRPANQGNKTLRSKLQYRGDAGKRRKIATQSCRWLCSRPLYTGLCHTQGRNDYCTRAISTK